MAGVKHSDFAPVFFREIHKSISKTTKGRP